MAPCVAPRPLHTRKVIAAGMMGPHSGEAKGEQKRPLEGAASSIGPICEGSWQSRMLLPARSEQRALRRRCLVAPHDRKEKSPHRTRSAERRRKTTRIGAVSRVEVRSLDLLKELAGDVNAWAADAALSSIRSLGLRLLTAGLEGVETSTPLFMGVVPRGEGRE